MLADNSSNFINNTYTDPEEKNTCINAPSLKVGGKGDLYVTAGTENSYGSVGINASSILLWKMQPYISDLTTIK